MSFRRSVPWMSQPQLAVGVNWANPLTQNLAFLALPNGAAPIIGGSSTPVLSSNNVIAPSLSGQGWTDGGSGSINGVSFGSAADPSGGATEYTSLVYCRVLSTPSTDKGLIAKSNSHACQVQGTSGHIVVLVNDNLGNLDGWKAPVAVSVGVDTVLGFSFKAPGNTSSSYNAIVNGTLQPASTLVFSNLTPSAIRANTSDAYVINQAGAFNWVAYLHVAWRRVLSANEIVSFSANPWQLFAPLTRNLPALTGTISRPGSDVTVTGWTFTGASLAASINEPTFSDASYGEAPYSAGSAITTLDLSLAPGSYTISFRGEYLVATAASGQFRFTALDGSNTSLGVSSWQAVTSTVAQYDVPITVAGGTAVRLKIEIQA